MVPTNDPALAGRLRLMRNLAFTEPRFRHDVAGFNFRMTGYQAAMGLAQLRKIDRVIGEKRRVAHSYSRHLSDLPGLTLPTEAAWAKSVYWMYALVVEPDFGTTRNELMSRLASDGIA